jgi:hypothetical protein
LQPSYPRPPKVSGCAGTSTPQCLGVESPAAPLPRHCCQGGDSRRSSRVGRKMHNRLKSFRTLRFRAVIFDAVWHRGCLSNPCTESVRGTLKRGSIRKES